MGHYIRCIIGHDSAIQQLANNWTECKRVVLNNKVSAIPMTDNLFDDINELVNIGTDLPHNEFELLSKSIEYILKEESYNGMIGYIETEYFGGNGVQSAILYYKGKILTEPIITRTNWDNNRLMYVDTPDKERAINHILYTMGIKKRSDMDAFDYVGLGNYRSNKDLLEKSYS
jgi:hypothetical protein